MSDSSDEDDAFYKSRFYADLGAAKDEIVFADGVKDTTAAAAKLAGKTLFNTGLFLGKTAFFVASEAIKNAPAIAAGIAEKTVAEAGDRMTAEQRAKADEIINKGRKK